MDQLYRDTGAVQVDGHRLAPSAQREFACTVRGFVNNAQPPTDAGHVDDHPASTLEHAGQQRQRQPHRGEEVDPHHRLDLGRVQRLDGAAFRHRGVVHQDVDAAEVVPGSQPEPADRGVVAQIGNPHRRRGRGWATVG
jgi:hypothetical protein